MISRSTNWLPKTVFACIFHYAEQLVLTPSPSYRYPCQQVCADYLQIEGQSYLTIDSAAGSAHMHSKHTNRSSDSSTRIPRPFINYGDSKELSNEGRPNLTSEAFQQFLKLLGANHRFSSTSYPQSNGKIKQPLRIVNVSFSTSTPYIEFLTFIRLFTPYTSTAKLHYQTSSWGLTWFCFSVNSIKVFGTSHKE